MINLSLVTLACQAFPKPSFLFKHHSQLSPLLLFSTLLSKFLKMNQTHPLYIICGTIQLYILQFCYLSERDLLLKIINKLHIVFSPKFIQNNIHLVLNGIITHYLFIYLFISLSLQRVFFSLQRALSAPDKFFAIFQFPIFQYIQIVLFPTLIPRNISTCMTCQV